MLCRRSSLLPHLLLMLLLMMMMMMMMPKSYRTKSHGRPRIGANGVS